MPRFFNTAGPCDPGDHYMLPPERRLAPVLALVAQKQYFVVHAARQTGKTTTMRALAAQLRGQGVAALHATLEGSQGAPSLAAAEARWLGNLARSARADFPPEWQPPSPAPAAEGDTLAAYLSGWAEKLAPLHLVLFLDEADVVVDDCLVSLLRQLRSGFHLRPRAAPASVALVGMRDLRDYLVTAKDGRPVNPGSPFNIKAASLTLQNFTAAEVGELYAQHEADTGQAFSAEAVARVHALTGGQPFLVNMLASICVSELVPDRSLPVTAAHVEQARERLVMSRTTHLDNLGQRLREPRVATIMSRVVEGDDDLDASSDDFQYCIDLGLLAPSGGLPAIANPIYREVIARELSLRAQAVLPLPRAAWLRPGGQLDAPVLVGQFLQWWRENSDFAVRHAPEGYREATVHLAFMAFLQKVVNGGGLIQREFAAGSGRVDLCVEMAGARTVIEIKRVRPDRGTRERAVRDGVVQLSEYLDTLGEREGWLLVFDQREGLSWDDRLWSEDRVVEGRLLHLRGA
ncbi:MAG: AAA family ATPase [Deltaproteobacteria bacterium]|nr:AAA family ATPase [Deltaproteobacteria bacterium]